MTRHICSILLNILEEVIMSLAGLLRRIILFYTQYGVSSRV